MSGAQLPEDYVSRLNILCQKLKRESTPAGLTFFTENLVHPCIQRAACPAEPLRWAQQQPCGAQDDGGFRCTTQWITDGEEGKELTFVGLPQRTIKGARQSVSPHAPPRAELPPPAHPPLLAGSVRAWCSTPSGKASGPMRTSPALHRVTTTSPQGSRLRSPNPPW